MKKNILITSIAAALCAVTLSNPGVALAQVTERTTTTTTTTAGTLSEFGPEAIVVRSETSAHPLRYTYSEKTTYVDAAGNPVTRETLRAGLPVTVHYTKTGDRLIAERVIVGGSATDTRAATTTTTTTSGTIADFGSGVFAVR